MTDYTEALLKAFSIVADSSLDTKNDKTIEATILNCMNTSTNQYAASYNGGQITIYGQNNTQYNKNDKVYVLIPHGDMSATKYILGLVSIEEKTTEEKDIETKISDYNIIGTNIVNNVSYYSNLQQKDILTFPLTLQCNKVSNYYTCYLKDEQGTVNLPRVEINETDAIRNFNNIDALLIKANFLTDLSISANGDYGIIVTLNTTIGETTTSIPYIFNTAKMTGNPMQYYGGSTQYAIFDFTNIKYNYIESIVSFAEGFVQKDTDVNCGTVTIKDLEICGLSKISGNESGYKLTLSTPFGNILNSGDNIAINARCFKEYEEITTNLKFYWGLKDTTINSKSESYNSNLGAGYKWFENEIESSISVNAAICTGKQNDIKCVCVCGDDGEIITNDITIYNDFNSYDLTITSDQGTSFYINNGNPTLTCLINGKGSGFDEFTDDTEFSFIWSKKSENGDYIIFDQTIDQLDEQYQEKIANTESLIEKSALTAEYNSKKSQLSDCSFPLGINRNVIKVTPDNATYSCQVYKNETNIGIAEITLIHVTDELSQNSYVFIKNGNQSFQYDENGNSPASEKKKSPIEIKNLEIEFIDPNSGDSIELNDLIYYWELPQNDSLIIKPTYNVSDNKFYNKIFPLKIAEKYDINATDNTIVAVVSYNGSLYKATTNFYFGKVGEPGTNGTNFISKISCNYNLENENYKPTIYNVNNQNLFWNFKNANDAYIPVTSAVVPFKVNLYENNQILNGYTTKWSLLGSKSPTTSQSYIIDSTTGGLQLNKAANRDSLLDYRTVKAETSQSGKKYYDYVNVPMIEYFNDYDYENCPIHIINNKTLDNIIYDADNANPQFNSSIGLCVRIPKRIYESSIIDWTVKSGVFKNNSYPNPNFTISFSKNSSLGGTSLRINNTDNDFSNFIAAIDYTIKEDENNCKGIKQELDKLFSSQDTVPRLIDDVQQYLSTLKNEFIINGEWINQAVLSLYTQYKNLIDEISNSYSELVKINSCLDWIRKLIKQAYDDNCNWKKISIETDGISRRKGSEVKTLTSMEDLYNECLNNKNNLYILVDGTEYSGKNFDTKVIALLKDKIFNDSNNLYLILNKIINQEIGVYAEKCNLDNLDDNSKNVFENQKLFYQSQYETIEESYNKMSSENKSLISFFENMIDFFDKVKLLFIEDGENYCISISNISILAKYLRAANENSDEYIDTEIFITPNQIFLPAYSNNNVEILITQADGTEISHIVVPFCFTANSYSLGSINGWDGVGIDINEDEGYILSPQIGAGEKDDSTNTFTGLVMGSLSSQTQESKIGLLGFHDGKQSLFFDAKTGNMTLGENNEIDGQIELIPGGTSKIANWRIGKDLLYNTSDGTLETRDDKDCRFYNKKEKKMVPQDQSGIILSSNMPYIHIKGVPFDEQYLQEANRTSDGYDSISLGDSLEMRLDPDNKSLFSIIQHTSSVDQNDMKDIYCGTYNIKDSSKTLYDEEFDINTNVTDKNDVCVTYYLPKNDNGKYLPYYTLGNDLIRYTIDSTSFGVNNPRNFYSKEIEWGDFNFVPLFNNLLGTYRTEIKNGEDNLEIALPLGIKINDIDAFYNIDGTFGTIVLQTKRYLLLAPTYDTSLNSFDQEVGYFKLKENITKQFNNERSDLYSFALTDDVERIEIAQPLTFSGYLIDNNVDFKIKFTLQNEVTDEMIAETGEISYKDYIGKIVFQPQDPNILIPKNVSLKTSLVLNSEPIGYNRMGSYWAKGKIFTDRLPQLNWEIIDYQKIGQYGNLRNDIYYNQNDISYTIKFGQVEGSVTGIKIVNNVNSIPLTFAVYCVQKDNYNKTPSKLSVFNLSQQGSELISALGLASSVDEWHIAVYKQEDISDIDESTIQITTTPKYKLEDFYFKDKNDILLKIIVDEPGNMNDKVPANKDSICCKYNNYNDIQGIPLAATYIHTSENSGEEYKGTDINLKPFKENDNSMFNKSILPYIGWAEVNTDEYIKYLQGLDVEKIKEYISSNDGAEEVLNIDLDKFAASQEYIKVGLDENGKFFSSGTKGQKTISKVGPVTAFKYYSGNGIDVTYTDNTQKENSVIKIFSNDDTTYFVGGKNESNKIHLISSSEINLSLFDENKQTQLTSIPNSYTGINIKKDKIDFLVEGNLFTFNSDLISKFSEQRLQKQIEFFDNGKYELIKLLIDNLSVNQIEKLVDWAKTEFKEE